MCVNAKVSITSFIVAIVSSLVLIFYGNKKYSKENLSTGIFFIYVGFMQLFEYFIWIDLDNKKGLNKFASILAPLFIINQPTVLYLIKSIIFNKNYIFLMIMNIIYFFVMMYQYSIYLNTEKLITGVGEKYLHWKWSKYLSVYCSYGIFFIINILIYFNINYALLVLILGGITYIISHKITNIDYNSVWCLFGANIPIFICIGSYFV